MLEEDLHEEWLVEEDYIHWWLQRMEQKSGLLLEEYGFEGSKVEDGVLEAVASRFTRIETETTSLGIDYSLDLKKTAYLVTLEKHPLLLEYLVSLPGKFSSEGIKRENHGSGYHIHYIVTLRKKPNRTNIVLTFNPDEPRGATEKLFWEEHGSGIERHPDQFGKSRRNAIFDTSRGFLNNVEKNAFRKPSQDASVLWKG
jgi:hypothetical protein